ncbi:MAG: hypothetical protein ACLQDQ_14085 [Myxococcaceae bacterium]
MDAEATGPLASAPDASAWAFVDRAVREVLPLGLEASGLLSAAQAVRALAGVTDGEAARRSMFALEKLARAHAAPELLVRAAHGVCACALSLGLVEAEGGQGAEKARGQLVSVLVRLSTTAVRAGAAPDAVVGTLAGGKASEE